MFIYDQMGVKSHHTIHMFFSSFPTGGKSSPTPVSGAPAHRGPDFGQTSSSSPEIEEAHEATSPSAYDPLSARDDDDPHAHFFDGTGGSPRRHSSPYEQIETLGKGAVGFEIPASLAPSKAPPLSLLSTKEPSGSDIGSPVLLPPASEERVRSLSGGMDLESSGVSATPSFTYSPKAKAKVSVSPISASPVDRSPKESSASESLHRLKKKKKPSSSSSTTSEEGIEMVTISPDMKKSRRKSRDDDVWIHVTARPKQKANRGSLENISSIRHSRKEALQTGHQRSSSMGDVSERRNKSSSPSTGDVSERRRKPSSTSMGDVSERRRKSSSTSTGDESERRRKSSGTSVDGVMNGRTRRASSGSCPSPTLRSSSPTPSGTQSYSPFSGRHRKSSSDRSPSPTQRGRVSPARSISPVQTGKLSKKVPTSQSSPALSKVKSLKEEVEAPQQKKDKKQEEGTTNQQEESRSLEKEDEGVEESQGEGSKTEEKCETDVNTEVADDGPGEIV